MAEEAALLANMAELVVRCIEQRFLLSRRSQVCCTALHLALQPGTWPGPDQHCTAHAMSASPFLLPARGTAAYQHHAN